MYDVIIVGSGIAGSVLANKLKGLDVLILEKNRKIILKDSGIVSSDFRNFIKDRSLIQTKIKEMNFIAPSGNSFSISSEEPFSCVVKRRILSIYLRKYAKNNAKIRYETAEKIDYLDDFVEVQTDKDIYNCKLLVGADGANSLVRKSAGIKDPKLYTGIFTRTKKAMEGRIDIHLNKHYSPDFFSWVIPHSNEYGLVTAIRPFDYFQYFKNSLNLPDGAFFSSPIPIGYTKSFSNRTILIGDACGQSKPLTGGGIVFSMTASKYAAGIINKAFEKNNFRRDMLKQYEKAWKKDFGMEIRKQMLLRRIYRKLSNSDIDNLFRDFGPNLEELKTFSYDRFTESWRAFPKTKLMKFFISNIPLLISRNYV